MSALIRPEPPFCPPPVLSRVVNGVYRTVLGAITVHYLGMSWCSGNHGVTAPPWQAGQADRQAWQDSMRGRES